VLTSGHLVSERTGAVEAGSARPAAKWKLLVQATSRATRLAMDGDPPVCFRRTSAVLTVESQTSEMMLRSRVIEALTDAAAPDWQTFVRLSPDRRAAGLAAAATTGGAFAPPLAA
jgi:hypothetical protein